MKKTLSLLLTFVLFINSLFSIDKPIVRDINAQVANSSFISISWKLPETASITKFWLYRSMQPIKKASDLKKAVKIAELDYRLTGWTDILPDYNDYYYAVIAVSKNSPYSIIVSSLNSTVNPVHMDPPPEKAAEKIKKPEKIYESGTLRETPLPYIVTDANKPTDLKEEISKQTVEAVKELTYYQEEEVDILKPYYFEEDLISPDNGDDYLLFTILRDYLLKKDYANTILELQKLIGTNITDTVQNRAYFYLGEAQYFSGYYEECVRTFVKISQIYPQQTKKWINSALDKI